MEEIDDLPDSDDGINIDSMSLTELLQSRKLTGTPLHPVNGDKEGSDLYIRDGFEQRNGLPDSSTCGNNILDDGDPVAVLDLGTYKIAALAMILGFLPVEGVGIVGTVIAIEAGSSGDHQGNTLISRPEEDICATGFGKERQYNERHEVEMLHKAIARCGRPIVLSLSPGPALVTESWYYEKYANMWRITDDFWDNWESLLNMFQRCEKWQDHVSQGCYPDCDMLPLGKIGKVFGQERDTDLTRDEQKTMMTLWCIFGSPLMLGAEMTLLDDWTLSLLQNKELLRLLNGRFISRQVLRDKEKCVWAAVDPATGECYIALFNFQNTRQEIAVSWAECAAMFPEEYGRKCPEEMTEIWSKQPLAIENGAIKAILQPHGTLLLYAN